MFRFRLYFIGVVTLKAEIISVGTELLLGEILDSNAAFLARELAAGGLTLHHKQTVGDNLERLQAAIREALSRADLVILGGGLGPTDDDLTREAIASLLNETPGVDPELLSHLRGLFESRGRTMPEANVKQAWLIPSAEALPNPVGTAPGWFVRTSEGKFIVALPGPPREMQRMWREQVLPRLPLPARSLYAVTLHTGGIGEGNVAELLGELTREANPSVATYARLYGTDVRVAASAGSPHEAEEMAAPVLQRVRLDLARFIWGEDGQTLPGVLGEALSGRTLAVTEAGSGGQLSLWLSELPGFLGGRVTSSHEQLLALGLTPVTLSTHGAVSEAAALELARGAREGSGADLGLAVTGETGTGEAGVFWVAFSGAGEHSTRLDWPGDPAQQRERAATAALLLALRALRAVPA